MKKIFSIVVLLASISAVNYLQAQAFKKNTGILNLGLGAGGFIPYWGPGYSSTPYFFISYDHGIYNFESENKLSIGLGGFLGYRNVWYRWDGSWIDKNGKWHYDEPVEYTWTYTTIGLRPSLNYSFDDKLMLYAALHIGYYIVNFKNSNPYYYVAQSYGSRFGLGTMVGGRYFFSKSFGVFAELGWAFSYANLGISLRFQK